MTGWHEGRRHSRLHSSRGWCAVGLRRRVTAALGAVALLVPMGLTLTPSASAVGCGFTGTGAGTVADPYLVSTSSELASIGDDAACMTSVFVQVSDIDLGAIPNWTPLAWNNPFMGTYYGDCYTIDHLTINDTYADYMGLFGQADSPAVFANMKFTNVDINADAYIGSVVGYDSGSQSIHAVSVQGTINAYADAGLIVGQAEGDEIVHASASGTITVSDSYAGGIAAEADTAFSEVMSDVDISDGGGQPIGGIFPYGLRAGTPSITNSYATGDVVTTSDGVPGGLVGRADEGMTISTSYATGDVVTTVTPAYGSGGLVGASFWNAHATVITYTDAFWDSQTTGQSTTSAGSAGGGVDTTTTTGAKTTAQMKSAATYSSWDPAVWNIQDGSYPTLKWFDDGGLDYCPRAATLDEASGATAGGTSVTITGRDWDAATGIKFGGVAATVTSTGTDSVTVTTPAGSAGAVDVTATVVVEGVSVPVTLASAFTYVAAPVFTADSPSASATVGSAYSYTFAASNATSFAVASGSLPAGLSLNSSTGVVSGTPTTAGASTFTVSATGPGGTTTSASHTITVAADPGPSGKAPSRPKQPVIVAGDGKVKVTVARGAGGGAPVSFTVSADPGTGSCIVTSATGGSCTISSGLTNGTEYTVQVTASNAHGTSPASVASEVFVPGPPVTPKVQPVSARQPAGGSALIVNGQPVPVTVDPNPSVNGLEISAAGLTMTLDGLDANGNPMNLDANGVLILGQDRDVQSTGTGFMPNSDVLLYVDPKVRAVGGRSKGIYVGTLRTDKAGTFSGSKTLPAGISVGVHDLQAVGVTPGNLTRALTLGVKVATVPAAVRSLAVDRATAKGNVFLAWKAPKDDGGSPVTRYQVAYRYVLASAWVREPNAASTQAVIKGLIPGCRYDVRVRAVNGVGAGPWSVTTVAIPAPGRMRLPSGDLRCLVK